MTRAAPSALALVVALAGTFGSALAHEGDPKELDRQPPYVGPGSSLASILRGGSGWLSGPRAGGQFASQGVTLLAWLPLGDLNPGATSANTCWGYTSPWGRDPGFVAPNNTSFSDGLEYAIGL